MKKRFINVFALLFTALFMLTTMTSCFGPDVETIKNATPYAYPDTTWGDLLGTMCKDEEWTSFVSEDNEDIVEFNGKVAWQETDNDLNIQFRFLENGEYDIVYLKWGSQEYTKEGATSELLNLFKLYEESMGKDSDDSSDEESDLSSDDEYDSGYSAVDIVKNGAPYDYPDQPWGEKLDLLCSDGEWKEFESEDGETIVEFNGTLITTESNLCAQFIVDCEEQTFILDYMDLDGEVFSGDDINEVVDSLFGDE